LQNLHIKSQNVLSSFISINIKIKTMM